MRLHLTSDFKWLEDGTITSPKGFRAGGTYAGIKTYAEGKLDLGVVSSEIPCNVAGTFTTNKLRSPSVVLDERRVATGRAQAVVCNSGVANACVGEQGMKDAMEMAALVAGRFDLDPELVLPMSTGVVGVELPMGLIRAGMESIELAPDGGHEMARAIQTTDTRSKEGAVSFSAGGNTYTIGGIAKGSGMVHPNMATMLAFLATDAPVESGFLRESLKQAVDRSFNMVTIDGDTSTNDSVILLANGMAGGNEIGSNSGGADAFRDALNEVCTYLAKEMVRDGEGVSKLIEVVVEGAQTEADARMAARSVTSSSLVKSAIHGADPNWGRIIVALGYSGAEVIEDRIALHINGVCLMDQGRPVPFLRDAVSASMRGSDTSIRISLNMGDATATAWGCNLSEEYVTFNSAYTT